MNLEELRTEIDAIDDTLVNAFAQRMDVVARVSQAKKEQGLPTLDPARERAKLADIASKLPPELAQYGYALWSMLFEISRGYQNAMNPQPSALRKEIEGAMASTPTSSLLLPRWPVKGWKAPTPSWPVKNSSSTPR
ncbi:MAG: chorismate mutase [Evtepia gabavorous]